VRLLPASDWSRNSTSSSIWDTKEEQLKLNTRFEIEEFKQQKWLEKLWIRQKNPGFERHSGVATALSLGLCLITFTVFCMSILVQIAFAKVGGSANLRS
jgi:hypothetical protein